MREAAPRRSPNAGRVANINDGHAPALAAPGLWRAIACQIKVSPSRNVKAATSSGFVNSCPRAGALLTDCYCALVCHSIRVSAVSPAHIIRVNSAVNSTVNSRAAKVEVRDCVVVAGCVSVPATPIPMPACRVVMIFIRFQP